MLTQQNERVPMKAFEPKAHVNRCWLASSVVAQQSQNLAFKHGHVQVFHGHLQNTRLAKLLRDNSFCFFVSYTCNSAAWRFSSYLIMSCPFTSIYIPIALRDISLSVWSVVWVVSMLSVLWLWHGHLLPCRRLKFSSQGQGSHHAARGSGFQPQGLGDPRTRKKYPIYPIFAINMRQPGTICFQKGKKGTEWKMLENVRMILSWLYLTRWCK